MAAGLSSSRIIYNVSGKIRSISEITVVERDLHLVIYCIESVDK